uniref:AlNc14C156G7655 protein n=1 Tax=Albugo laibachii Nc14 TaxID=890382 RepID=F0WMG5_9STRA|nr:AlNc14C156G7655 [Albugo laibachii Nc14]|eukprot:CCA22497.1 AlNc14C156G7655 [Albugo laibachii Nc14]
MRLTLWFSILALVGSSDTTMNDSLTLEGHCAGRLMERVCNASEKCRWNGTCSDKSGREERTTLLTNRTG